MFLCFCCFDAIITDDEKGNDRVALTMAAFFESLYNRKEVKMEDERVAREATVNALLSVPRKLVQLTR